MAKYASMTPEQKAEYMRNYRLKHRQGGKSQEKGITRKPRKPEPQGLQRKPVIPRKPEHYRLKFVKNERHYVFSRVNDDGSSLYMGTRGRSTPIIIGNLTIDLDWADDE